MSGWQCVYPIDDRDRILCGAEPQIILESPPAQPPRRESRCQQASHLRAKREALAIAAVIQRLDAPGIADQPELLLGRVPYRCAKHPAPPLDRRYALLRPGTQRHLGIAMRLECMPSPLQRRPQLEEVVNLAVESDDVSASRVHHRL